MSFFQDAWDVYDCGIHTDKGEYPRPSHIPSPHKYSLTSTPKGGNTSPNIFSHSTPGEEVRPYLGRSAKNSGSSRRYGPHVPDNISKMLFFESNRSIRSPARSNVDTDYDRPPTFTHISPIERNYYTKQQEKSEYGPSWVPRAEVARDAASFHNPPVPASAVFCGAGNGEDYEDVDVHDPVAVVVRASRRSSRVCVDVSSSQVPTWLQPARRERRPTADGHHLPQVRGHIEHAQGPVVRAYVAPPSTHAQTYTTVSLPYEHEQMSGGTTLMQRVPGSLYKRRKVTATSGGAPRTPVRASTVAETERIHEVPHQHTLHTQQPSQPQSPQFRRTIATTPRAKPVVLPVSSMGSPAPPHRTQTAVDAALSLATLRNALYAACPVICMPQPLQASVEAQSCMRSAPASAKSTTKLSRSVSCHAKTGVHGGEQARCSQVCVGARWCGGRELCLLEASLREGHYDSAAVAMLHRDGSTSTRPTTLAQRKRFRAALRARLAAMPPRGGSSISGQLAPDPEPLQRCGTRTSDEEATHAGFLPRVTRAGNEDPYVDACPGTCDMLCSLHAQTQATLAASAAAGIDVEDKELVEHLCESAAGPAFCLFLLTNVEDYAPGSRRYASVDECIAFWNDSHTLREGSGHNAIEQHSDEYEDGDVLRPITSSSPPPARPQSASPAKHSLGDFRFAPLAPIEHSSSMLHASHDHPTPKRAHVKKGVLDRVDSSSPARNFTAPQQQLQPPCPSPHPLLLAIDLHGLIAAAEEAGLKSYPRPAVPVDAATSSEDGGTRTEVPLAPSARLRQWVALARVVGLLMGHHEHYYARLCPQQRFHAETHDPPHIQGRASIMAATVGVETDVPGELAPSTAVPLCLHMAKAAATLAALTALVQPFQSLATHSADEVATYARRHTQAQTRVLIRPQPSRSACFHQQRSSTHAQEPHDPARLEAHAPPLICDSLLGAWLLEPDTFPSHTTPVTAPENNIFAHVLAARLCPQLNIDTDVIEPPQGDANAASAAVAQPTLLLPAPIATVLVRTLTSTSSQAPSISTPQESHSEQSCYALSSPRATHLCPQLPLVAWHIRPDAASAQQQHEYESMAGNRTMVDEHARALGISTEDYARATSKFSALPPELQQALVDLATQPMLWRALVSGPRSVTTCSALHGGSMCWCQVQSIAHGRLIGSAPANARQSVRALPSAAPYSIAQHQWRTAGAAATPTEPTTFPSSSILFPMLAETYAGVIDTPRLPTLLSEGLWPVYQRQEAPLVPILARMRCNGVAVSYTHMASVRRAILAHMATLSATAQRLVGRPFLITSPEAVAQVLYRDLSLPQLTTTSHGLASQRKTKHVRPQKHHSTSENHLVRLKELHPVPGLILRFRKWHKLVHTYIEPVARAATAHATTLHAHPTPFSYKHVAGSLQTFVHPVWHQTTTGTGRVACSAPNLQSMPHHRSRKLPASIASAAIGTLPARHAPVSPSIAHASGQVSATGCENNAVGDPAEFSTVIPPPRSIIVPRATQLVVLAADYNQIEMRMAAHLSADPLLMEVFREPAVATATSAATNVLSAHPALSSIQHVPPSTAPPATPRRDAPPVQSSLRGAAHTAGGKRYGLYYRSTVATPLAHTTTAANAVLTADAALVPLTPAVSSLSTVVSARTCFAALAFRQERACAESNEASGCGVSHGSKPRENDIYKLMASKCFCVDYGEVTALQREAAKGVALGTIYGMGAEHLAHRLRAAKEKHAKESRRPKQQKTGNVANKGEHDDGVEDDSDAGEDDKEAEEEAIANASAQQYNSQQLGTCSPAEVAEARRLQDVFFQTYSGLKGYMQSTIAQARLRGRVQTITGRIRSLPHINATQQQARAYAERQAVNTVIQGSAGDVIKTAMANLDAVLYGYCGRVASALQRRVPLHEAQTRAFSRACHERGLPVRCVCSIRLLGNTVTTTPAIAAGKAGWHDGGMCMEALLRCVSDITPAVETAASAELPTPEPISTHDYAQLSSSLLIMQLHDEVVMEMPRDVLQLGAQVVEYCMLRAAPSDKLLFPVSMRAGADWGELVELMQFFSNK